MKIATLWSLKKPENKQLLKLSTVLLLLLGLENKLVFILSTSVTFSKRINLTWGNGWLLTLFIEESPVHKPGPLNKRPWSEVAYTPRKSPTAKDYMEYNLILFRTNSKPTNCAWIFPNQNPPDTLDNNAKKLRVQLWKGNRSVVSEKKNFWNYGCALAPLRNPKRKGHTPSKSLAQDWEGNRKWKSWSSLWASLYTV